MDNLKVIKGYGVTLYNLFNLVPGGSFSMNDKRNQYSYNLLGKRFTCQVLLSKSAES